MQAGNVPVKGQEFSSMLKAEYFVRAYTYSQGFAIVGKGTGTSTTKILGCYNPDAYVSKPCKYGFKLERDVETGRAKIAAMILRHEKACVDSQGQFATLEHVNEASNKCISQVPRASQHAPSVLASSSRDAEIGLHHNTGSAAIRFDTKVAHRKDVPKPHHHIFGRDASDDDEGERDDGQKNVESGKGEQDGYGDDEADEEDEVAQDDGTSTASDSDSETTAKDHTTAKPGTATRKHVRSESPIMVQARISPKTKQRTRVSKSPETSCALAAKKRCIEHGNERKPEMVREVIEILDSDGDSDVECLGQVPSPRVAIRQEPDSKPKPIKAETPELSFFDNLPVSVLQALQKIGMSSVESLRASKMKEKDVIDILLRLRKEYGFSELDQMVASNRICEAISQFR